MAWLSMPVGFKTAPMAVWQRQLTLCAPLPSRTVLLALTVQAGCVATNSGESDGHVILRGGKAPNYSPADVAQCEKEMEQADCARL